MISDLFVREIQSQHGDTSIEILFIDELVGTDVTKNVVSQTPYIINTFILV